MLPSKFFNFWMLWCLNLACQANSFYEQVPDGFLWYGKTPIKEVQSSDVKQPSPVQSARMRNEKMKRQLEDAIQIALDNPSLENAIYAQRLQKQVMGRSEDFSKMWTLAALMDSGLITQDMNPNGLHRSIAKEDKAKEDLATLKKISQDWGLLLTVEPNSRQCERFASIVFDLQNETDFQVLALSQTGEDYGPFKGRQDRGLIQKLDKQGFPPTLYLVHKSGKRLYPVARGLTDRDTVKENILNMHAFDKQGA